MDPLLDMVQGSLDTASFSMTRNDLVIFQRTLFRRGHKLEMSPQSERKEAPPYTVVFRVYTQRRTLSGLCRAQSDPVFTIGY